MKQLTAEMIAELADSRFRGESDLHFYARWTRQKANLWLEAADTRDSVKARALSTETIATAESYERAARFYLESAVELLSEELKKVGETNPSLPIQRLNGLRL